MRRLLVLLIVVSLLGFGCLDQKGYPGMKSEQITNSQSVDLDGDGSPDYMIYDFTPITVQDSNMILTRQVTVAVQTTAEYTDVNPNMTDVDLLMADQSLDEFSKTSVQSDSECSNNIGLVDVVCSDVTTCSRLCSSASIKCKKVADTNQDLLAGSMISYVQDNNAIRNLLPDARQVDLNLRGAPLADQNAYLVMLRNIVYEVASINSNPLYTSQDIGLCDHSDFGIPYVVDAENKVGNYSISNVSYTYRVLISAKPITVETGNQIGVEVTGITLTDRMPRLVVPQTDNISSIMSITATQDAVNTIVSWSSDQTNKNGYMLMYEFKSDQPPEVLLPYITSPDLTLKRINLTPLIPTNFMYVNLYSILNNYYLAIGVAFGLTFAILMVIYNAFILGFTLISEKAAGANVVTGFRRAFGRTDVRWRTDILIAVLFLGAGTYIVTFMATQPTTPPGCCWKA